jgi:hypothetical protein
MGMGINEKEAGCLGNKRTGVVSMDNSNPPSVELKLRNPCDSVLNVIVL